MQKSFTLEDLSRYSREVYLETQRNVNRVMNAPGPSALAIRNILQYSKALRISTTKAGGPLFLILN
jgi:hypothetical protein